MNVFVGFRTLDPDVQKSMALVNQVKIFPYAKRANPPATRVITPDGKKWYGGQPDGMAYWQRLHAIYEEEPVEERDRFFVSSRQALKKNPDGSIDLCFAPSAPAGHEANWVQTVSGHHWFAYFRLYGPTEAYFDKSWVMNDIQLAAR